jgi:hypothetical protein
MALASIILSILSLVVAAGSLYLAYLAWRRTGSDRRLRLRQDARELGLLLDDSIATIARARGSRQRVLSMEQAALSGNAKIFEDEATADDAELKQLQERARAELAHIDRGISDDDVETKLVDAAGIKTRVVQIREKYLAALAEDDKKRAEKRQAMHDLGNRIRTERTPPQ